MKELSQDLIDKILKKCKIILQKRYPDNKIYIEGLEDDKDSDDNTIIRYALNIKDLHKSYTLDIYSDEYFDMYNNYLNN